MDSAIVVAIIGYAIGERLVAAAVKNNQENEKDEEE